MPRVRGTGRSAGDLTRSHGLDYPVTVISADGSSSADAAPAAAGTGDAAPAAGGTGDARQDAGGLADLVDAVRCYRNAEGTMRSRSRDSMHLGKTDMTALRLMLLARQSGRPLSAVALSRELRISTAATTVLIDRLEKSGHAERRRSDSDGRSIEIWPTAATNEEVRSTMGALHERMMATAAALSPGEIDTIRRFLGSLGTAMSELDFPEPPPESEPGPDRFPKDAAT